MNAENRMTSLATCVVTLCRNEAAKCTKMLANVRRFLATFRVARTLFDDLYSQVTPALQSLDTAVAQLSRDIAIREPAAAMLLTLTPILPPQPLTRWAIDFTTVDGVNILVAVEYATHWVKAEVTPN